MKKRLAFLALLVFGAFAILAAQGVEVVSGATLDYQEASAMRRAPFLPIGRAFGVAPETETSRGCIALQEWR